MLNSESPKPLSKVVSESAYRFGLSMSIALSLVLSIVSFYYYTKFSFERMGSAMRGVDKSLSQSVALGDIYEITKQFDSLVESGSVSGLWLYEADSLRLLQSESNLDHVSFDPIHFKSLALSGSQVVFADKRDIVSKDGKTLAHVISCITIPLQNYIMIGVVISIVLVVSTIAVARRFTGLCQRISDPIIHFADYLSKRQSLDDTRHLPDSFAYSELQLLYRSHLEMASHLFKMQEMEKDAAIGRITAQLSHDMRAPLGAFERIIYSPHEDFHKMKGALQDALNRLHAMIDSLRRGEAESLVYRRKGDLDFNFGRESLRSKAAARNIQMVPPENISQVWIDHAKVERAWFNLVSNAMDSARTFVKTEAEIRHGDLILSVMDDGLGIPAEFESLLFQRGATLGKADGTGLGLAYVRQVMRGHGGDVVYRRDKGLTIFECRLPAATGPKKEQTKEMNELPDARTAEESPLNVAICIDPPELCRSVLNRMSSLETKAYHFSKEQEDAHIVVSNLQQVMIEVLEQDKEYVSVAQMKADVDRIVAFLIRKFELHAGE